MGDKSQAEMLNKLIPPEVRKQIERGYTGDHAGNKRPPEVTEPQPKTYDNMGKLLDDLGVPKIPDCKANFSTCREI